MRKASLVRTSILVKGDTIDYWDTNSEKPVLLLIHGFGATTKYQWFRQVEMLSEHYRVIMPNLLHFGRSYSERKKYSVADQVEMVHNLIVELGINNYTMGGVSYGGLVAAEMAIKYPEGLKKLFLLDAAVKFLGEEDIERVTEQFDVPSIEALFVPEEVKGLKKLMYLATMKKSIMPASWLTEFHKEMYLRNFDDKRKLIITLMDSLPEYQQHDYSSIEVPVMLIWGSNDVVIPADRGEKLREHIGRNAFYRVIKNGGHMPALTKIKKFNKVLMSFLSHDYVSLLMNNENTEIREEIDLRD
ncbi:MAG: alpha/beta hydrolase [Crocinitomicaceae bacterium]|nr:alpha/beta hydrolase [Crocinitomicaceae bacterium]